MSPTKRIIKGGGNAGKWEVNYGIDEAGKRRRPSFATEADADADTDRWKKE